MPKGVANKRYTGEFKQLVVETMLRDKLSYREAARQFEVPDHKDVAKWERYYLMDCLYCTESCAVEAIFFRVPFKFFRTTAPKRMPFQDTLRKRLAYFCFILYTVYT